MKKITNVAPSFRSAWVQVVVALVSCSPASEDESKEETVSCEDAASHFWAVCTDFMGTDSAELLAEGWRVDCIAMEGLLDDESSCIARSESCEDVLMCEFSDITFDCDTSDDCAEGLFCSADPIDCVACIEDADCADGKLCLTGLCIDEVNTYHELLQ